MKAKVASMTFPLHGFNWKVLLIPTAAIVKEAEGQAVSGLCDYDTYTIFIDESLLGKPAFADTFWHEVSHAVFTDIRQMKDFQEEVVVDVMSRAFPQMVRIRALTPKSWGLR